MYEECCEDLKKKMMLRQKMLQTDAKNDRKKY